MRRWTVLRPRAVSTLSRPKAAEFSHCRGFIVEQFQHSAARRRLLPALRRISLKTRFQHSAARRRLDCLNKQQLQQKVSTLSRPKAAGSKKKPPHKDAAFQHSAARRRLGSRLQLPRQNRFQHSAARRRLRLMKPEARLGGSFNTQPPEGG